MDDITRKEMEESLAEMTKACGGAPFVRVLLTAQGPEISTNIPDRQDVLGALAAALMHYQVTAAQPLAIN